MTQKQQLVSSLQRRHDCSLYDSSGPIVGLLRNGRFFAVLLMTGNGLTLEERQLATRVLAMRGLFIVARTPADVFEAIQDALTDDPN